MKRVGADPNTLLKANAKRNCLDRISVPKRVAVKFLCLKFKVSFYYCLFCIFLIDWFILCKDIIQIAESLVY